MRPFAFLARVRTAFARLTDRRTPFERWMAERLVFEDGARTPTRWLFADHEAWRREQGLPEPSRLDFVRELAAAGIYTLGLEHQTRTS